MIDAAEFRQPVGDIVVKDVSLLKLVHHRGISRRQLAACLRRCLAAWQCLNKISNNVTPESEFEREYSREKTIGK